MAPAKTGSLKIRRTAVTTIAQIINGRRLREYFLVERAHIIVDRKLILPRIEDTPAKWRLKIAKSTEIPEWNLESDKGG